MSARLPKGWKPFRSQPNSNGEARWYAAAPYDVDAVRVQCGVQLDDGSDVGTQPDHPAWRLARTVSAESRSDLAALVAEQVELYEELTRGEAR